MHELSDVHVTCNKSTLGKYPVKNKKHLVAADGNNDCVDLHTELGSEIRSEVVTRDARGDAFQCRVL